MDLSLSSERLWEEYEPVNMLLLYSTGGSGICGKIRVCKAEAVMVFEPMVELQDQLFR